MIPRSWSEVTIEQYQALEKTFTETPETPLEEHNLRVKRALILTERELSEIEEMTMEELSMVDKLLRTPMPKKFPEYFRLNGHLYQVIKNPSKEKAKRYMMAMNACKNPDNLSALFFSICKPKKGIWRGEEDLDAEQVLERLNDFKKLPVSIAMPIKVFFCNLSTELTNVILQYSEEKLIQMKKLVDQEVNYFKDTAGLS